LGAGAGLGAYNYSNFIGHQNKTSKIWKLTYLAHQATEMGTVSPPRDRSGEGFFCERGGA